MGHTFGQKDSRNSKVNTCYLEYELQTYKKLKKKIRKKGKRDGDERGRGKGEIQKS